MCKKLTLQIAVYVLNGLVTYFQNDEDQIGLSTFLSELAALS